MPVHKIIEVIATSENSFDDAARNAITEAAKSVSNIKSVYIKDFSAKVKDNKITSFGVNAKVTFEVQDKKKSQDKI